MLRLILSLTFITFSFLSYSQLSISQDVISVAVGEYVDYNTITITNDGDETRTLAVGLERICYPENGGPRVSVCFGAQCFLAVDNSTEWELPLVTLAKDESTKQFKIEEVTGSREASTWRVYFFDLNDKTVQTGINIEFGSCASAASDLLTTSSDTVALALGDYVDYGTFTVTNNSDARRTLAIGVERLCRGSNTVPAIEICFGLQCFERVDSFMVWNIPLVDLAPGASSTEFKFTEFNNVTEGSSWRVNFFDINDTTVFKHVIFEIAQCGSVSVDENFQTLKALSVYPNPAQDYITLDLASADISKLQFNLFDQTGRLVMREQGKKRINIDHLQAGQYFYKATLEDKVLTSPIIIE